MLMTGATKLRSPDPDDAEGDGGRDQDRHTRLGLAAKRCPPNERGTTPSSASACNTRGAAITLPNADDSVAAQTPIRIGIGQRAMSCMIRLLVISFGAWREAEPDDGGNVDNGRDHDGSQRALGNALAWVLEITRHAGADRDAGDGGEEDGKDGPESSVRRDTWPSASV